MYPYGTPYAPQQPQIAANPYYRQNLFVPPGAAAGPVPSPTLRKVKLACGIVQIVTLIAAIGCFVAGAAIGGDDGGAFVAIGMVIFSLLYVVLIAYGIMNMIWLYKIWSWIPPEQRHTKMWKKYISPGTALGFMFIPYFNIYWMFVIYLGLCDIFERMQVAYPTSKPSPRNLALMTLIIPIVFFPAGPFMHYFFDTHVEGLALEMQARMGRPIA